MKQKPNSVKAWASIVDGKIEPFYIFPSRKSAKQWNPDGAFCRVEIRPAPTKKARKK